MELFAFSCSYACIVGSHVQAQAQTQLFLARHVECKNGSSQAAKLLCHCTYSRVSMSPYVCAYLMTKHPYMTVFAYTAYSCIKHVKSLHMAFTWCLRLAFPTA